MKASLGIWLGRMGHWGLKADNIEKPISYAAPLKMQFVPLPKLRGAGQRSQVGHT
jgi:hypothetical protein